MSAEQPYDPERGARLRCESCGSWRYDVTVDLDPYAQDVHGEEIQVVWCEPCYQESADGI